MNILSFDIEEWALAKARGESREGFFPNLDAYLNRILDELDKCGIKATFFCIGLMAIDFPQVVRLIQSRGHEIGCHSHSHIWMNKMSADEAQDDTHSAVDALEQCIGEKVRSYRAPAFSIGESNKWMFEILAENGIECDASIFPAKRDFGGFANFGKKEPCTIEYKGIRLKEFPICTAMVLGKEMAYSGGGYFRLFPLWYIKQQMGKVDYTMSYFHIDDLIPEYDGILSKSDYEQRFKEPGTLKRRYLRYFKSNIGKGNALTKLNALIRSADFINVYQAEELINWNEAPVVVLYK